MSFSKTNLMAKNHSLEVLIVIRVYKSTNLLVYTLGGKTVKKCKDSRLSVVSSYRVIIFNRLKMKKEVIYRFVKNHAYRYKSLRPLTYLTLWKFPLTLMSSSSNLKIIKKANFSLNVKPEQRNSFKRSEAHTKSLPINIRLNTKSN